MSQQLFPLLSLHLFSTTRGHKLRQTSMYYLPCSAIFCPLRLTTLFVLMWFCQHSDKTKKGFEAYDEISYHFICQPPMWCTPATYKRASLTCCQRHNLEWLVIGSTHFEFHMTCLNELLTLLKKNIFLVRYE